MGDGGRTFLDFGMSGTPVFDTAGSSSCTSSATPSSSSGTPSSTEWDVLLSPTWTQPAFAHGADIASVEGALGGARADASGRAGQPARAARRRRAVRRRRRPAVGAQFTARRFADLTALAAAQAVEDAVGPLTPIDPVLG